MPKILQHQDRTVLLHAWSYAPHFPTVRGQQTVIRDALGGYPLSGEIDKALRFLDWEGSPIPCSASIRRAPGGPPRL